MSVFPSDTQVSHPIVLVSLGKRHNKGLPSIGGLLSSSSSGPKLLGLPHQFLLPQRRHLPLLRVHRGAGLQVRKKAYQSLLHCDYLR